MERKLTTDEKAKIIIQKIEDGQSITDIKASVCLDSNDWYRCSSLAYQENLKRERKYFNEIRKKTHSSTTSEAEMNDILSVNSTLANYALSISILITKPELNRLKDLVTNLPNSESDIINLIGDIAMQPRLRAQQKKGRIEKFDHFKIFAKMIDAALLSYYRTNYISSYLTLLPIVEGIIIRWMGYTENAIKPEFDEIKKFFKNSATRQPCPFSASFHEVYCLACDEVINKHFYKSTDQGQSYANFNRHVASHILNDNQFATRENCIRLFNLIDMMTEIYLFESRNADPRFTIHNNEIEKEVACYTSAILDNLDDRPEHMLLDTDPNDILRV